MRWRRDGRVRPGHDKRKSFASMTRESITRVMAIAFIAAGVWIAYLALTGFTDYSPGNSTIQGVGFCSGSPTLGQFLIYDGSKWCGSDTLPQVVNQPNGGYPGFQTLGVNGANDLVVGSPSQRVFIQPGDPFVPSSGGIQWNADTDLTEVNAPRSTFSAYIASLPNGNSGAYSEYYNSAAITIRSYTAWVSASTAGCTTSAVMGLANSGTAIPGVSVTLAAGGGGAQATGLAVSIPAGDNIEVYVTTAPAGCTTSPANINVTVEYTIN